MNKKWQKALTLGLALLMCGSIAACQPKPSGGGGGAGGGETVDENRYQFYVHNYDGGYGKAWLEAVKARYEEAHKNDSYPGGKTGIQIMIEGADKKAGELVTNIPGGHHSVYFSEFAYYYELLEEGVLGDITDAVTVDAGDGKGSIESKLTEQQKAYYKVDGKYYGIPHYAGYQGIVYNKRLFDENRWYFAETPAGTSLEGKFITEQNPHKSKGPNNIANDYDDGLPRTYEEFFWLCQWIDGADAIAVGLNGVAWKSYSNGLATALAADYTGLEQGLLNYTFDGTATSLATMDDNGNVVLDADPTPISEANGYELARQAGKAYALKFIDTLFNTDEGAYLNDDFDEPSYDHLAQQRDFIKGNAGLATQQAMMIEGIWWQSEATTQFDTLVQSGKAEYGMKGAKSDYGWMPFPKATSAQLGQKGTLYDGINSMIFMKPGLSGKDREIAIDFIKYCNTHQSLVEFTQVTGTPKALNYSLNGTEKAQLTPFSQSLLTVKENSDILYPYATSNFYKMNQRQVLELLETTTGGLTYIQATEALLGGAKTAKQCFDGIYTWRSTSWAQWISNAQ